MKGVEITVTGDKKLINNLYNLNMAIYEGGSTGLGYTAGIVKRTANQNLYATVVGGHSESRPEQSIRDNWRIVGPNKGANCIDVVIGNESLHACIVNSKSMVSLDDKTRNHICCLKSGDTVLSKDGNLHKVKKVISDLCVGDKPNLVRINCEHSYMKDGLLLTNDHLVIAYNIKNNYPYWEQVGNLKIGDYVIKKIKNAWNKNTRITSKCECCGEVYKANNSSQRYCSQKCYHKINPHNHAKGKRWNLTNEQRLNKCGKNNSAWKGGISKLPYGKEWTKLLKQEVKNRDNYMCQECGVLESNYHHPLVVHHKDGNKFNNSKENLITLCPSCHGKIYWQRDCELITLDMNNFKPERITKLERVDGKKLYSYKNSYKRTKLWDLSIDGENSFVVEGIVVHNSMVEFGTGVYSEKGSNRLIFPTHSPFLKFKMDGDEWRIPYSKGQHPKAYLRDAVFENKKNLLLPIRDEISKQIKVMVKP